ncbi:MAG TPA: hypothetical protein VJB89_02030 [Candidatus Nanoarchaeia archaeon]|nr:hypothetical protein [Candidatus Nanoarchaeia archaeon]
MFNELVKKIKEKKTLKNLDDSFVQELAEDYLKRNKIEKKKDFVKAVKEIRNYLNKIYGQFWGKEHKSYVERKEIYHELYKKIFSLDNFKRIVDISCGMNILSYNLIPDYKNKEFIVSELTENDCIFLNKFFIEKKIKGKVYKIDLNKNFKLFGDISFFFKLLDLFSHKDAERILESVNSKVKVVSFSKINLKGKKMNYLRRGWFEIMIKRLNYEFEILNFKNEIFYILRRIRN